MTFWDISLAFQALTGGDVPCRLHFYRIRDCPPEIFRSRYHEK